LLADQNSHSYCSSTFFIEMTAKINTKNFLFLAKILSPNFPSKYIRILIETKLNIVQIWNVIPR